MTLSEVASLYDKTYYQLLEECQIRLQLQGNENKMLIIMPVSPLVSTPPIDHPTYRSGKIIPFQSILILSRSLKK